jgi:hypothetical protein
MQELVLYNNYELEPLTGVAKIITMKKLDNNRLNAVPAEPHKSESAKPATMRNEKPQIKLLDPILRPKKHECF